MSQPYLFEMEWGTINQKNEIEIDASFMFQEIERELSEYLLEEKSEGDSTDGAFNFIGNLTNKLQTKLEETIGRDGQKKQFIRSLTGIFAILLKLWSEQN